MKKFREYTTWKIGDYFLQLSVVILGIIVTFAGSNAISRHAQSKEIATTLQLVRSELKMNLQNVKEAHEYMLREKAASSYLLAYQSKPQQISEDSLAQYINLPFRANSFSYTSDALEMLKMSSLAQQIRDKEMVLQIVAAYNELKQVQELIEWYNGMKSKYIDRLENSKNFVQDSRELKKEIGENLPDYLSDKRNFCAMYALYLNYTSFSDLNLFITHGVNLQIFHQADAALEQAIEAIQVKYGRK